MDSLILRDYQKKLADDITDAWTHHRAVLAWLPTGGGKTEIAVHFAQRVAKTGGCTLFVVDRKTLAGQTRQRYATKYGMLTGLLRGEDTFVRGYEPVVIATVQTLRARSKHPDVRAVLDRVELIVLDEAHIRFKHHDELASMCPNARILGLSATPLRDGLAQSFGALVRGPSYADLIEQGHLVGCRYFVPHTEDIRDALKSINVASTGDYVPSQLSALMRERTLIGDVVAHWRERGADRSTICFAVDIAHSKALCDMFLASGVAAEHIDHRTDDDERAEVFSRFRYGVTRVLCSVAVLAVGFDSPIASCAILARPTLSLSLHIQQIGRVMRPHAGKADALILDHAANVLRHGKVETFEPPELSEIDGSSDRKPRQKVSACFACHECRAVLSRGQRVCSECGHELARRNVVDFRAATLIEHASDPRTTLTTNELRTLYLELRFIHEARGHDWGKACGIAFAQLKENYNFIAPWSWRSELPRPPSQRTINLATSWRIAYSKAQLKLRRASIAILKTAPPPCRACGSTQTTVGPGKGPHAASLRCGDCDAFVKWLPACTSRMQPRNEPPRAGATP